MLIMLNAETVIFECLLGAKRSVARLVGIPVDWVIVRLEAKDGKHIPVVDIQLPPDAKVQTAVDTAETRAAIKVVVREVLKEINERIADLGD